MKAEAIEQAKAKIHSVLQQAGIALTVAECKRLEVTDVGLDRFEVEGLGLLTYINNERYCAKELVLLPRQTFPEHRHPPVGLDPGKMETFRCRSGRIFLNVEGAIATDRKSRPPQISAKYYTVFHEIELRPGDQFTIPPNTLHWFQAGDEGALVSEFSSTSRDELDVFTDPQIRRVP